MVKPAAYRKMNAAQKAHAIEKGRIPDPNSEVEILNEEMRQIELQLVMARRQAVLQAARTKFMPFVKFTSPDPEDPNDAQRSRYQNAKHHDAIARVLEEVEKGEIRQLILTMPPRHGKSELTTRRFPAWFIGRNPRMNVAVATYSDTFAEDFGRDVRSIIQSHQFKQTFPDVRLLRGSTAADRLMTEQGGMLMFVGRGGSLTGRGAHCFVGATEVLSPDGNRQIRHLRPGDEVISYDQHRQSFCTRRVQAISRRAGARIFRVSTAAGRVVEATGDHPFFVSGRWIEAAKLTPGDRLLCGVRAAGHSTGVRRPETQSERSGGVLLLQQVLGHWRERAASWPACLHPLRRASTTLGCAREPKRIAAVLLGRVLASRAAGGVRAACAGAAKAVRTLQRYVYPEQQLGALLWAGLCVAGARRSDGKCGKSALARWTIGKSGEAARHTPFPGASPTGLAPRREPLRTVLDGRRVGSASHRREPVEQSGCEFGDALPRLPHASAFLRREVDFVCAVEDTGRSADVFDIQVEGTHCFFANGILVHNCLIIDDLIKDDKEASSQAVRDQAWNWFTKVAMTRRMGKKLVIVIMTRWHSDDIIGRLTDPENPCYNEIEAKKWKIINLPAIAEDDDPLGREPGQALWPDGPDGFDEEFLASQQRLDPLGFSALYQQRPSAADGVLFRREHVRWYDPAELPQDLRMYCASDHAISEEERRDWTVLLSAGVDKQSNLYLTDCYWNRASPDKVVEAMLNMAAVRKPLLWWAGRDHITKSIGPFLRKRMVETNVFFNLVEVTPAGDKETRAQSIAARMAIGLVWFPKGAPWAEKAVEELMRFPNGTHDDFVDAFALFGLGLQSQFAASTPKQTAIPKYGTLGWIKWADKQQRASERGLRGGW